MDNRIYLFTTKDLSAALKKEKLPSSWMQIKAYFDSGKIPKPEPEFLVSFHRKDTTDIAKRWMPVYTEQQIREIVTSVAELKRKKKEEAKEMEKEVTTFSI